MISIVIPVFNEAKVIEKTLTTLKGGLTLPHEIIVCDDNSADNTAEIAKRYADRVVVRPQGSSHVISATRNAGVQASTGEFLAFFDADFIIPNPDDFFRTALADFEKDPKLVAVTGKVRIMPELETAVDRFFLSLINASLRFQNNVLHHGEAMGKLMIMRRSAFDAVHGFREDLITREDGDLFNRLSKIGKTHFDPRLVVLNTWRRAHQIGWPRMLSIWMWNAIYFAIFNKAHAKEWKAIR